MENFIVHFQEYLITGLLIALFFKDSLEAFIRAKMGLGEKTPEWGEKLTQYANHDTTASLDKIQYGQDKMRESLEAHNKLDERIIVLLEEQKEYGVKIRT